MIEGDFALQVNERASVLTNLLDTFLCLVVASMLLLKGGGLTDLFISVSFILWLFSDYRKNKNNIKFFKHPLSIMFFIIIGVVFFSIIFSINPLYSFKESLTEPLKALALFIPFVSVISTDKMRLERIIKVMFFSAVLAVFIVLYSYVAADFSLASPKTILHAHPNRFSKILNIYIAFIFALYFIWDTKISKAILILFLMISLLIIGLSGSRGGFIVFVIIGFVWFFYMWRKKIYNIIPLLLVMSAVIISVAVLSVQSSYVQNRMRAFPEHVKTMTGRTVIWKPAYAAFEKKPFFGWGYGRKIFKMEEPYSEMGDIVPHYGPHSTFVRILFHQGLIGFIPYVVLILYSIVFFWKGAIYNSGINSLILCGCVSALIGEFVLHSMIEVVRLHYLALVIGFGLAAYFNSNNQLERNIS